MYKKEIPNSHLTLSDYDKGFPPLTTKCGQEVIRHDCFKFFKEEVLNETTLQEYNETILFYLEKMTSDHTENMEVIWEGLYKQPIQNKFSNWETGYEKSQKFAQYKHFIRSFLLMLFNPHDALKDSIQAITAAPDISALLNDITEISALVSRVGPNYVIA